MPDEQYKRRIAYKMRIGDLQQGKIILEGERFKFLEYEGKEIIRINLIANITDKFVQDEEKKYATLTLDDASGQIRLKTFGEDIVKFEKLTQGDTILVIGMLRSWNDELYITPEIIKKKDPRFLLVRKLEINLEKPKPTEKSEISELKNQIIQTVKKNEENGGVDVESMILELKSSPETINIEIKKLLEEGIVYEPRPGKLRYLG